MTPSIPAQVSLSEYASLPFNKKWAMMIGQAVIEKYRAIDARAFAGLSGRKLARKLGFSSMKHMQRDAAEKAKQMEAAGVRAGSEGAVV